MRAPSRAATPSAAGRGLEEARIEAEYDGDSGLVVNDADWPG